MFDVFLVTLGSLVHVLVRICFSNEFLEQLLIPKKSHRKGEQLPKYEAIYFNDLTFFKENQKLDAK